MSHCASAGVSHRIKPNQWVPENGHETFLDADPHIGRVPGAGITIVLDATGVARVFRRLAWNQGHQHSRHPGKQRWDTKKPSPFAFADAPGADGESRQDEWRQVIYRHLA